MGQNPKDRIGVTKVPLSLLPPTPQAHTALALLDGMIKYGRWNWREEKVAASVYLDACKRHIEDWNDRSETAADSGVHHLGHAAACLFIIMDAQQCGNLIDDRAKVPGNCEEMFTDLVETVKKLYARHGQVVPHTVTIPGATALVNAQDLGAISLGNGVIDLTKDDEKHFGQEADVTE